MSTHKRRDHFMRVGGVVYPRRGGIVNRQDPKGDNETQGGRLSAERLRGLSADELRGVLDDFVEEIEQSAEEEPVGPDEELSEGEDIDSYIQDLSLLSDELKKAIGASQRVGFTASVASVNEHVKAVRELDKTVSRLRELSTAELEYRIERAREDLAGMSNVGFRSDPDESASLREYLGELEQKFAQVKGTNG